MQNIGQAKLIGVTAHELLTHPNFSARVIAVVANAVYLRTGDDEIVWLAQSHLPMHPRAILGAFDFSGFRVGAQYVAPLHIADAPVWSPPEISREQIAPREIVRARIQVLEGFAKPSRTDLHDLIGLGEGLTPAGDDFVGGVLFARHWLHKIYSEANWDQRAVDELIEYARVRTSAISFAILRDHARGHSVAPMHALINALIAGKAPAEIARVVQRIVAIGNTSGREMLAGVRAAIRAWAE